MTAMDDIDSKICFAIYNANKKFNRFYQDVLGAYDLTYPQYIVMVVLWQHAPITVRELGSYVDLDSGTLTPLIRRLQKKGWLTKERSTKDERVINIKLTEYAKNMADEINSHVNSCFTILGMSKSEIKNSLNVSNKIVDQLDHVDLNKIK